MVLPMIRPSLPSSALLGKDVAGGIRQKNLQEEKIKGKKVDACFVGPLSCCKEAGIGMAVRC